MTPIRTIAELRECRFWRKGVLAHGCFDLLHIGHIKHLKAAAKMGDLLIVTLTPDRWVNKGDGRPVFNEQLRAEAIAELRCVDAIAINEWPTAVHTIRALRPKIYVKGSEFRGNMTPGLAAEKAAIESIGGQLIFTDEIEFHSTDLMRRVMAYG